MERVVRVALEAPSVRRGESYRALVQEFVDRGEDLIPFPLSFPHEDLPALVERLAACSRGEGLAAGWVPHSTYWLVLDDIEVVGVSNLRHRLTDKLRREGGNIGYGVRPSARGRGLGRELLRLTLLEAGALGLHEVLLTCDKSNERSVRTIISNGGGLASEEFLPEIGETTQRYWLSTRRRR